MDRREDRGGPGGRKKWGGKQAEPVARLEPDREGGVPLIRAPPAPRMRQLTPIREACFFLMVAPVAPPHSRSSPPPPASRVPRRALCEGFHLRDSSEAWQRRTPGYRLGQKGPQKAEKVGRRRACIVPAVAAVANWQQAT